MSVYRPYYNAETFGLTQSPQGLDVEYADGRAVGLTALRFYTHVLSSQPFEVAKFLLQIGEWENQRQQQMWVDSDSSDEEVDYFIDTTGAAPKRLTERKKPNINTGLHLIKAPAAKFPHAIELHRAFVLDLIGAVAEKEGPAGLWRALHASCLLKAASDLSENWLVAALASLLGVSDPDVVDILQSPDPSLSVAVSCAAASIAAFILIPVALVRARLLITGFSAEKRSLRYWLFRTRSLFAPLSVVTPTVLSSFARRLSTVAAPLLLFQKLDIDEFRSPGLFKLGILSSQLLSLIVRLPLDTMANRALVSELTIPPADLLVVPKMYPGILSTVWRVLKGVDSPASLYRGWRLEALGIFSSWGYEVLDQGRNPTQEHF